MPAFFFPPLAFFAIVCYPPLHVGLLRESVLVIAVSIGIAWVSPDAAKYCWLLLAVAPRIADRWSGRQSSLPSPAALFNREGR